jgi:hypothetical protein
LFTWIGQSDANRDFRYRVLQLHVAIPINFNFNYFRNNLEGKRMVIDSTNGYFSTYNNDRGALQSAYRKGRGVVYFNRAFVDTTLRANDTLYSGKISGLLEVKFDSLEFKNGRFDHQLENNQIKIH